MTHTQVDRHDPLKGAYLLPACVVATVQETRRIAKTKRMAKRETEEGDEDGDEDECNTRDKKETKEG